MKKIIIILTLNIVWAGTAQAAPLTFNTALPISKNEYILREQLIISNSVGDLTETNIVSTLVYGVSPNFAVFGTIPYTNIDSKTNDKQGIGNSKIFGRYTIYQNDFQGGTFRIAPFAGVKIPTNQDNIGTESWDVFSGIVVTYGSVDWELDGQVSYQINTESNQFEAGDVARADISLQYRILPLILNANTDSFINAVLEVNLIDTGQSKTNGISDLDSGGTTLFLAPGLQYVAERYIAEIGVQIPVIQNLNGTALENDYIFRTGLRINF